MLSGSYLVPDRRSAFFTLGKVLDAFNLPGLAERAKSRGSYMVSLSSKQRQQISDLYRATNSAVQRTYGVDLEERGYPMAESSNYAPIPFAIRKEARIDDL